MCPFYFYSCFFFSFFFLLPQLRREHERAAEALRLRFERVEVCTQWILSGTSHRSFLEWGRRWREDAMVAGRARAAAGLPGAGGPEAGTIGGLSSTSSVGAALGLLGGGCSGGGGAAPLVLAPANASVGALAPLGVRFADASGAAKSAAADVKALLEGGPTPPHVSLGMGWPAPAPQHSQQDQPLQPQNEQQEQQLLGRGGGGGRGGGDDGAGPPQRRCLVPGGGSSGGGLVAEVAPVGASGGGGGHFPAVRGASSPSASHAMQLQRPMRSAVGADTAGGHFPWRQPRAGGGAHPPQQQPPPQIRAPCDPGSGFGPHLVGGSFSAAGGLRLPPQQQPSQPPQPSQPSQQQQQQPACPAPSYASSSSSPFAGRQASSQALALAPVANLSAGSRVWANKLNPSAKARPPPGPPPTLY